MDTTGSAGPVDYVHLPLHRPVTAIGGQYELVKEVRLPFRGREVLYVVGYTVIDTSCCGVSGFAYARVAGFVLVWKGGASEEGWPVSRVEPVRDGAAQREIRRRIRERETVHQIQFR